MATETIATTKTVKITTTYPAESSILTKTKTVTLGQIKQVCFSATEDCESILIDLIKGTRKNIHVMIYSFTLDELSEAPIEARNRGVDIKVIINHRRG